MRIMMRVSIPAEPGNAAIKSGELARIIQNFMAENKPEAAYFGTNDGLRTAYFVVDVADSSRIPVLAEPFFMGMQAHIDLQPVMNAEDLGRGLAAIAKS